jgi:hypothetical protein
MKIIYSALAVIFLIASNAAISEEVQSKFEFETVDATLAFLKTKPSVTFSTTQPDGWLFANDTSPFTIWSFTPSGHYAHPAVVKREVKQGDKGDIYIEMTALCQAEKSPCDLLIAEFQELNNKIIDNKQ